ncbi:hypothetical protein J4Q44_G00062540 [Coregonus suidteri]|uniref:Uncharacterized protein n=1 Tax=Coregonus suidteri TaxID=861788 RepID=A0AAN8R0P6_9TELE
MSIQGYDADDVFPITETGNSYSDVVNTLAQTDRYDPNDFQAIVSNSGLDDGKDVDDQGSTASNMNQTEYYTNFMLLGKDKEVVLYCIYVVIFQNVAIQLVCV